MTNHQRKRLIESGIILFALASITVTALVLSSRYNSRIHPAGPASPARPLTSPLISKSVDKVTVHTGEPFTYSIIVRSVDGDNPTNVTDTLSSNVMPNTASYTYTSGSGGILVGPPAVITWTGNLTSGQVVTLSVQVSSSLTQTTLITNTASVTGPSGSADSNEVFTIVEPHRAYLPIVMKPLYRLYFPIVRNGS